MLSPISDRLLSKHRFQTLSLIWFSSSSIPSTILGSTEKNYVYNSNALVLTVCVNATRTRLNFSKHSSIFINWSSRRKNVLPALGEGFEMFLFFSEVSIVVKTKPLKAPSEGATISQSRNVLKTTAVTLQIFETLLSFLFRTSRT